MPDDQQVIDVDRLVEDVRERVAQERSKSKSSTQQLAVREVASPSR
jgi:ribosome-binding protein aMBF1 (putative translation factor)